MHDSETDTIVLKSMSEPKEICSDEIEKGDYYSRCYAQTPRMVTNKGCLEIKKSNIDAVQIIQKG